MQEKSDSVNIQVPPGTAQYKDLQMVKVSSKLFASSGGDLLKTQERYEVLMRQIDTKVNQEGKNTAATQSVPYSKLMSLATPHEKRKMYCGWVFAALTGAVLPSFFFLIGDVMDSFGGATSPEEMLN